MPLFGQRVSRLIFLCTVIACAPLSASAEGDLYYNPTVPEASTTPFLYAGQLTFTAPTTGAVGSYRMWMFEREDFYGGPVTVHCRVFYDTFGSSIIHTSGNSYTLADLPYTFTGVIPPYSPGVWHFGEISGTWGTEDPCTYKEGNSVTVGFTPFQGTDWLSDGVSGVISSIPVSTSTPVSNVLFIPGIEGSRLYENLPCNQGVCETKVWEPHGDELAMHLMNNPDGQSTENGVYVKASDILDNAYVPVLGNVYKSFIEEMNTLKSEGTIHDWEAVAYDWRFAPDQIVWNGDEIAPGKISYLFATSSPYIIQELKRLAASSKTGKVTIIAHSYGGLVTKALINAMWGQAANLVDKIIFVAVPQVGTPQAIGALLHGYDQGLPVSYLPYGLTPTTGRTLANNMPMTYNLLPSERYLSTVSTPVVTFSDDPLLADFRSRYPYTYNEAGLRAFIDDTSRASTTATGLNYPAIGNVALHTNAEVTHQVLDAWSPPGNIQVYEIAGWGKNTLSGIHYYQGVESKCDNLANAGVAPNCIQIPKIDYSPRFVLDGDGSVVTPSALWTLGAKRYWVDLQSFNKDNRLSAPFGHSHADILEVSQLRSFLKEILMATSTELLPQYISSSQPPNSNADTKLNFELHSPLSLDLYDDQGNHTGISTTTGQLEQNIPESEYNRFGEVQFISLPSSTHAHLALKGQASGSFTLHIDEVLGETIVASTTFAGVPSATSTRASLDVPEGGVARLKALTVDENADGVTDFTLVPKQDATVFPEIGADVTPPEIKIIFNQGSDALAFLGVDESGSVNVASSTVYPILKKGQTEYKGVATTTLTTRDAAGNVTKLLYTELLPSPPQRDTIIPFALVYNNATTSLSASVSYKWRTATDTPYRLFASFMRNATTSLESHYRPKKLKTILMIKPLELNDADTDDEADTRPIKQIFPGMVVPYMVTQKGNLIIIY